MTAQELKDWKISLKSQFSITALNVKERSGSYLVFVFQKGDKYNLITNRMPTIFEVGMTLIAVVEMRWSDYGRSLYCEVRTNESWVGDFYKEDLSSIGTVYVKVVP